MSSLPEVEEPIVVPHVASTVTLITTPFNQARVKEPFHGLHLVPTPPSCPKDNTIICREVIVPKDGSAKGKREAPWPIVTKSDEDEPPTPPDSPRESRGSTLSPTFHDHDYENVSSPGGSSTTSETPYVRQPGFAHHAHSFTISKPKSKKKKTNTAFILLNEGLSKVERTLPARTKPKRDPIPMKMRAFPQSFWQQPNVAHNVSPAQNYPLLPPLVTKDGEENNDVRPVSPTCEDKDKDRLHKFSKVPERKVTTANTDLLFKLFEGVEKEGAKSKTFSNNGNSLGITTNTQMQTSMRRGRPRKIVPVSNKTLVSGEDPYLVDCVTDSLFPQLTIEHSKALLNGTSTLQVITLREGDKCVTLPSLSVEQNYSQMLSELVMHI